MKTKEGLHGNVESDSEDGCTKEDKAWNFISKLLKHSCSHTDTHTHSKDLIYSRWSHFLLTAAPLGTQKSLYPI